MYVRPTCAWSDGVAFLAAHGIDASAVPGARTLYGLGFQGDVVKTYALTPDGFVSWRIDASGLREDSKLYRAEVAWDELDWPDARWARIGALGRELGFARAHHLGESSAGERKLYVERIGGIPTDRSLA